MSDGCSAAGNVHIDRMQRPSRSPRYSELSSTEGGNREPGPDPPPRLIRLVSGQGEISIAAPRTDGRYLVRGTPAPTHLRSTPAPTHLRGTPVPTHIVSYPPDRPTPPEWTDS